MIFTGKDIFNAPQVCDEVEREFCTADTNQGVNYTVVVEQATPIKVK